MRRQALGWCAWLVGVLSAAWALGGEPRAERADDAKLGHIYLHAGNTQDGPLSGIFELDAASGTWRKVAPGYRGRVSADGRVLAYATLDPQLNGFDALWTVDLQGNHEPKRLAQPGGSPLWSGDGAELLFSTATEKGGTGYESWRIRADGTERKRLEIPRDEQVLDASADGRWLLTARWTNPRSVFVRGADGSDPQLLTERDQYVTHRLSPDGKQVTFARSESAKPEFFSLWIVNRDGTGLRKLITGRAELFPFNACWSSDGRWLAVDLVEDLRDGDDQLPERHRFLQLYTAEGKPGRRFELPLEQPIPLDWR